MLRRMNGVLFLHLCGFPLIVKILHFSCPLFQFYCMVLVNVSCGVAFAWLSWEVELCGAPRFGFQGLSS